ncbi:MAG: hypothetical protein JWL92_189, partial [Candidatus Nomurabacteria bacterium]|nr:hypothetical protein [Candidatus Nomurabacteria bacterium]
MKTFPIHEEESRPEAWSYELLAGKALQGIAPQSCILDFDGLGKDETVYNPCPFVQDGELCLLGRVEAFTSEIAHVHQFKKSEGRWRSQELSFLNVQDPFLSCVKNQKIV